MFGVLNKVFMLWNNDVWCTERGIHDMLWNMFGCNCWKCVDRIIVDVS